MPSTIHPTAIIESGAVIGEDCQIGPYCVIGPQVTLGNRCVLQSHVVLDGHTTIGDENQFFSFACIGKLTQDLKYDGGDTAVVIGNNNVFREYVTVHMATGDGLKTTVGSNCLIQAYCHIAHDCIFGSDIIMSSGAMVAGHVEAGDHSVIMGKAGIVPFVKIGRMGLVGGFSKLTQDVLPFSIADGSPAELRTINKVKMERCGFDRDQVRAVSRAYKTIIRSNLSLEDAIAKLQEDYPDSAEVQEMIAFCQASQRGLARPTVSE